MKISALKEKNTNEMRVSISPDSIGLFKRLGFEVIVEEGAGENSGYPDHKYLDLGATIVSREQCLDADVCLCVNIPKLQDLENLKEESILIGILNPFENKNFFEV